MNFNMKKHFIFLLVISVALLFIGYGNHFNNGFYFDDTHTIVHNLFIRDISNIPSFFTNIETFGTMPDNRGFRPIVTTLNAIDYWLAGGLNSSVFHITYFAYYIIQLVILFFFLNNYLINFLNKTHASLLSLCITAFYGLHAANAETINYIISRSDQFSTLCILLGLLLYQKAFFKKYYIFLLPILIGLGTKETTAVFPLVLLAYALLSDPSMDKNKSKRVFLNLLPIFLFVFGGFYLIMSSLPQISSIVSVTFENRIDYLMTQSIVITHYIANFILPIDLSVDSDFVTVTNYLNHRVVFSTLFLISLIITAIYSSTKQKLKPIAFGLFWFFIALAPTSSLNPMGQIANDHRTFFPYIGLSIAALYSLYLLLVRIIDYYPNQIKLIQYLSISIFLIVISAHSFGIRQRNIVWSSSELLWKDGVQKSPNNARTNVNYGLALMARGDYEGAKKYFLIAEELNPYWSTIKINLGVLNEGLENYLEAENYYKTAINYTPDDPDCYYFYARFLYQQHRDDEAILNLNIAKELSPAHDQVINLMRIIAINSGKATEDVFKSIEEGLERNPNYDGYIELGRSYYTNRLYEKSIWACNKAIELNPNNAIAYNNLCVSYNSIQEWEKAIVACEKAIELDPNFQLAKNNLNWAVSELEKQN